MDPQPDFARCIADDFDPLWGIKTLIGQTKQQLARAKTENKLVKIERTISAHRGRAWIVQKKRRGHAYAHLRLDFGHTQTGERKRKDTYLGRADGTVCRAAYAALENRPVTADNREPELLRSSKNLRLFFDMLLQRGTKLDWTGTPFFFRGFSLMQRRPKTRRRIEHEQRAC